MNDNFGMLLAVTVGQLREGVDDRLRVHPQAREGVTVGIGDLQLGRGPRRRKLHCSSSQPFLMRMT